MPITARVAGIAVAGLALLTGCAAPVVGSPTPAAGPAGAPAPGPAGAVEQVVACLQAGIPGATINADGDPAPGSIDQIFVDISRPDLPKGTSRLGVARFPDPDTARGFVASVDPMFQSNGGSAAAVGPWALTTARSGNDAAIAAARRCVSAGT
jgi:hypothetical protein